MLRPLSLILLLVAPIAQAEPLRVLLDWYINPDHAPIIIAQQRGLFAEHDLEVELIVPTDPADPPKQVAAGQGDIAVFYQPQMHLAVHNGLPLRRIGTLVATPLNCLVVLEDGPKTIADLRGGTIGFSIPGMERALLGTMLGSAGVRMDEVELVKVGWSIVPSLLSKQVDAVLGAFRNFELHTMQIKDAPGRCFYPEEHGVPAYDELIYVAHADKLEDPRFARFIAATEQAAHYLLNHPQEGWELFSNSAAEGELDTELYRRAWADTLSRLALRPAALDRARYQRMEAFLHREGLVDEVWPVARIAAELPAPH